MKDHIYILRPFVDLEESAKCLSVEDLPAMKILLANVIRNFLAGKPQRSTPDIMWYWNKGKPYLGDLVEYYEHVWQIWIDQGGSKIDFLKKDWDKIASHECAEDKAPWTEAMSNTHKFYVMNRNHFWYQRHWCDGKWNIRYRRLKEKYYFEEDGSPRRIQTSKIRSVTYEFNKGH